LIYSDLDLMQMQAEALFVHDANGKLLRINEPDPTSPAPHFFLGRTAAGNLWRTHNNLPVEIAAEFERLAPQEPISSDLSKPPHFVAEYMELLKPYAPLITINAGPAYYLPKSDMPHDVVIVTPENRNLVQAYFPWLYETLADYAPVVAAVEDGDAVAVCFCSRITPQVAEAGVYTEGNYRGRGYATKVAQGWAAATRSTGRLPLYSTSWSNHASQAIARKLGAVQYGTDYSIT
jgi:RimJ/RimL family protein N-acetyltransferase